MRKAILLLAAAVLILAAVAVLIPATTARALPEYAAQTGEPCATCHASPSGGGLRTPRGQAWVGSGRPGTVPALNDALTLLGVHLAVDESDFAAPEGARATDRPAAQAPSATSPQTSGLAQWLGAYEGN